MYEASRRRTIARHRLGEPGVEHEAALITTLGWSIVAGFACGYGAARLKLPPMLGYLVGGVVVGPYTPGFVADKAVAQQAADIGVILLMFGVGLKFSPRDFASVRWIAIVGAVGQTVLVTLIGALAARLLGWSLGSGLVLGLALSVASTIVALRELERAKRIPVQTAAVATGWLVVEDVVVVVLLVLLPVLAPIGAADNSIPWRSILERGAITLGGLALFVIAMMLVGSRVVPWFLGSVASTGSRELFTLAVLAIALGIALGASALFGASVALGAFFAGLILSESDLSHRAGADALPMRDAFAVLFFVSVGMLFDPSALLNDPLTIAVALLIVLVAKPAITALIAVAFRQPMRTVFALGASRAQIGEFSFILVGVAAGLGLADKRVQDVVVIVAVLSIALAPLAFRLAPVLELALVRIRPLRRLIRRHGRLAAGHHAMAGGPATMRGHVVLVGHGRAGSAIARALAADGETFVVVEPERRIFDELRARAVPAVLGNAADEGILRAAGVAGARLLIVTAPDVLEARRPSRAHRANRSAIRWSAPAPARSSSSRTSLPPA
jgi:monovalent cation:H+ antiporter-2, CPA2 family